MEPVSLVLSFFFLMSNSLGLSFDSSFLDKTTRKQDLSLSSRCDPDPDSDESRIFADEVFKEAVECVHSITNSAGKVVRRIPAQVFFRTVDQGIQYAVFFADSGWYCFFFQSSGNPSFIAQQISGDEWVSMFQRAFTPEPGKLGTLCF